TKSVRLLVQYVAETGRMTMKPVTLRDSEAELIKRVRDRLFSPQKRIKVSLDDL
ncbi:type II toxin-antitoxin system RelB/DinJ family antitoxin, partial [Salmonella enterica]|uniref:type II toxin-antitoxin system RelB/DinJ family antitoxin n=1 Tax=Salmonella enterica TaxID=28901 RepID=UPI00398C55CE